MADPLLRKRTVLAVGQEATEGTPVAIGASHAKFLASDVVYKPDPTLIERNVANRSFARNQSLVTIKLARITFRTEIVGSGTADTATAWSDLLEGCGFKETVNVATDVQYDPVTNATYGAANGNVTLTIWVYEDGKVKKAHGCRGTVRFVGESGGLCFAEWDFLGVYDAPADASLPALAAGYDSNVPPILESAAFDLHAIGTGVLCIRNFTIDIGNTITPRYCANSATGIKSVFTSDRAVVGSIDPESLLLADWSGTDATKKLMDGDVGAFTLTVGTVAGNKVQFVAPAATVQITSVDESDRDGLLVDSVNLLFGTPLDEDPTDKEIRIVTS